MLGRAIALVLREAIAAEIRASSSTMMPVARDLGDDRGGRDRQAFGIALDDASGWGRAELRRAVAVDEGERRLRAQARASACGHRREGRLQDIDRGRSLDIDDADADLGPRHDDVVEFFAPLRLQLLRIVDASRAAAAGSRMTAAATTGPAQRPAPGFIDAGRCRRRRSQRLPSYR